jgi:hypothetical protein
MPEGRTSFPIFHLIEGLETRELYNRSAARPDSHPHVNLYTGGPSN